VSADDRFLTNSGIGEHDHAALLAHLATPAAGGWVWQLYTSDMPGLPEVLWRVAPYALGSGAVLVGVFLWHLGWRLGPLEPPPGRVPARPAGTSGGRRRLPVAFRAGQPSDRRRPEVHGARLASPSPPAAGIEPGGQGRLDRGPAGTAQGGCLARPLRGVEV
jgi:hypothetical protein